MATFKLILLLITVNCIWLMTATSSSISSSYPLTSVHGKPPNSKDESSSVVRKSRQLRCVRCYDNRNTDEYYSRDNRDRYYPSEGTYSGRSSADSRPSTWYQPKQHYDRYDERYGSDRDYDRYYSYGGYYRDRLDNRQTLPRTYDQYNDRGYDRYEDRRYNDERRDSHGYDRYTDDYYRGRKDYGTYYDHVRSASAPGYDRRDYYDRDGYYKRYDDRNYRTLDASHRQPSAFENSGRGYYFADSERTSIGGNDEFYDSRRPGEDESRYSSLSGSRPSVTKFVNRDPAYLRDHHQSRAPCSRSQSSDCNPSSSSSSPADSSRSRPENSSHPAADNTGRKSSDTGGYSSSWRSSSSSSGANTKSSAKQSSSYSGQPSRTLSGSYLLDRDSNTLPEDNTSAKNNTNQSSAAPSSVDNPKSMAFASHIDDADINQEATKPTEKY